MQRDYSSNMATPSTRTVPPVDGYAPRLAPRRAVCSLPWAAGGVRMADVPIMIRALQAKIIKKLKN